MAPRKSTVVGAHFEGLRSMKHTRIIVTHYGGPDALRILEEECLDPQRGEARIRVQAAGVALPDVMAREGTHPETPTVPFTPGWDLVGEVERLGDGVTEVKPGQIVAALPIHGAYAEYVCLPQSELVPVPPELDATEAVSLVLNYITAYQMLHYCAHVKPGQSVLIHGAGGGVGTALLQLGRVVGLQMYGSCSERGVKVVSEMGATPVDYKQKDVEQEIQRLTNGGVDAVFDPLAGRHLWHSRKALRPGGRVVGYGIRASMRAGGLTATRPGHRQRYRGTGLFALYILGGWLLPGRKRVVPYSIQTLKRLKPAMFRRDLMALFDLLREKKIKPLIANRFPLTQARQAHELLEAGGVIGKIVLVPNGAATSAGSA